MFHARLPHHYAQTHDLGNVAPVIGRVYKCRPVNLFFVASFFLFLCHAFNEETPYLDARGTFLGEERVLHHTWLFLWIRDSPGCQPWWVARARGVYAMLQVFSAMMSYSPHSHGLLQAFLTTLEITPSLTSGRSVYIRITTRR